MHPASRQSRPLGGAESLEARSRSPRATESLDRGDVAELLTDARARTLALVEPVSDADLNRVHDPLMSPLVWDLGHIAAFEDLWLSRHLGGLDLLHPELADVYDAAETPRADRGELPYLRRDEALAYLDAVRERALSVLDTQVGAFAPRGTGCGDPASPIWDMIVQHEQQHNETMLQTLQLAEPGVYAPTRRTPGDAAAAEGAVTLDAGPFTLGADQDGFVYDNERPAHATTTGAYRIDRAPVTNGDYLAFVEDGGYRRRELWSPAGWEHREREGWERPLYWTPDDRVRSFERIEPPALDRPVMHVSWFEADAFTRWRGARLPTEAEWERAARELDAGTGHLDQLEFGPGPAGPFVGDCWEWTATEFQGYPGFRAWPYPEYSEVFFGAGYRVLRGASWATRPRAARVTFRNWDHPQRRQIFAGFRCAEDVG